MGLQIYPVQPSFTPLGSTGGGGWGGLWELLSSPACGPPAELRSPGLSRHAAELRPPKVGQKVNRARRPAFLQHGQSNTSAGTSSLILT